MKMKHVKTKSLTHYFSSSSYALCTVHLLFCLLSVILPTSTASTCLYSNETDRIALLDFKLRISDDPHGVLHKSWNDSLHHCQWHGVSCGRRHQRVVALWLPEKGLVGTISPQIGNLTFLRDVNLSSNNLYGQIPGEIGGLFRLKYLDLSVNTLTGELVAVNLSNCLQLREFSIFHNGLHGKLPTDLVYLKKLQVLDLSTNQLTGSIPPSFGNFSLLLLLGLDENHLQGSIPHEITQCWGLKVLSLAVNNLTGTLSPTLFNMSSIKIISLSENLLHGIIPTYIGDTMPNLEQFAIGLNKFHGTIPVSFPNATKLQYLELSQNYFVGKVPDNIGKLKALLYLNLEHNLLGSNGSFDDLAFIPSLSNCSNLQMFSIGQNRFEGSFPTTICNFSSQLSTLILYQNKISGTVPIGIQNLASLTDLALAENLLSGVIPSEIGCLPKLQALTLSKNQFSGEIPSALFNLTSLCSLVMDNNNLYGNIPSNIGNLWNLDLLDLSNNKLNGSIPEQVFGLPALSMFLNLSYNSFTGPLSPAVGKLKTLNVLDISGNKLSGKIPESLGHCLSLESLDMHDNNLEGIIPPTLFSLKGIQYLDISKNKLRGVIPREFQRLQFLQHLNLSFNDLDGEVPTVGIFAMATNVSLLGNKELCGGVPELKLPPCHVKIRKHRKLLKLIIVIFTSVSTTLIFASLVVFLTLHRKKDKRKKPSKPSKPSKVEKLSKISYSDLHQATDGFSTTTLIGSGSFGSVYKGKFPKGGQIVAVKVLDLLKKGASKSFLAECKALRNIRHRNLVPILTCCSSCDFAGNEFKALVYEFMEKGDLDMWLHTHSAARTNVLSVLQRLNIAIDVASALCYLHDDCEPPIIHCDLKPSNILLDNDLTAHVGDFGLSRIYSQTIEDSSGGQTSSVELKGSIGYVPPEYGIGAKPSTFGDVYSYGILLLEMFTAKRPTYNLFNDECCSFYEYVESALPEQVMKIVDPLLLANLESNYEKKPDEELDNDDNLVKIEEIKMHGFFLSIFKIGLSCASSSPLDRTHMKDVTSELQEIKKAFFV